jgi:peptidoglycan/xylan/chitin deacetylase (PgdA/CDA1 family)
MYFCIRDDDTSFFTSPEQLDQAYGEITRWGPVSLAVVPFHRAGTSKGVPEKFRGRWTIHPLHENSDLVQFLRGGAASGRFEIMLHGYHHDEPTGQSEFAGGKELVKRVADGRKYLEDVIGVKIRVFVAPRNAISYAGLRALAVEGLHFGGVAGASTGWPLWSGRTWKLWHRLRRWRKAGGVGVPWILDLGDHREIAGIAVTPTCSFNFNQQVFDTALKINGVFCLATHYWELSVASIYPGEPTVGDHLKNLIDRARSDPRIIWRSVGDTIAEAPSI